MILILSSVNILFGYFDGLDAFAPVPRSLIRIMEPAFGPMWSSRDIKRFRFASTCFAMEQSPLASVVGMFKSIDFQVLSYAKNDCGMPETHPFQRQFVKDRQYLLSGRPGHLPNPSRETPFYRQPKLQKLQN